MSLSLKYVLSNMTKPDEVGHFSLWPWKKVRPLFRFFFFKDGYFEPTLNSNFSSIKVIMIFIHSLRTSKLNIYSCNNKIQNSIWNQNFTTSDFLNDYLFKCNMLCIYGCLLNRLQRLLEYYLTFYHYDLHRGKICLQNRSKIAIFEDNNGL